MNNWAVVQLFSSQQGMTLVAIEHYQEDHSLPPCLDCDRATATATAMATVIVDGDGHCGRRPLRLTGDALIDGSAFRLPERRGGGGGCL